jgi:hypothetical protein
MLKTDAPSFVQAAREIQDIHLPAPTCTRLDAFPRITSCLLLAMESRMKSCVRALGVAAGTIALLAPAACGQAAAEYRDHTQAAGVWPQQAVRAAHYARHR